jgi:uncharacterized protein YeaO (DUF488 family)
MANAEMYDYLSTVTPDYTATTLNINPQGTVVEKLEKNQSVHDFDDGSDRVINLDDDCIFMVNIGWPTGISKSNAGIIFDFYADTAKANAKARSFYWVHPEDGHTYVVKFRSELSRNWAAGKSFAGYLEIPMITLKVIGRKADS